MSFSPNLGCRLVPQFPCGTPRLQLQPCHLPCGSQMPVTCLPRAQVSPVLSHLQGHSRPPPCPHLLRLPHLTSFVNILAFQTHSHLPLCSILAAQPVFNLPDSMSVAPLSSARGRRGFADRGDFLGAWKLLSSKLVSIITGM